MSRFAFRLLATCSLLVGLVFLQDPGFLVADTKFDLATAPGDFLARALHLWDAEGAFGQLQNQAYGYLWPMGPFFWLGAVLDLPGWVVQRLWQSLVVCAAFTGAARLARALGVRSDLAAVVAGVAFALSPRMLTTLGPISIEAWPSALAPWVLLPLVLGSERGSPRRAAALSALAVAMVGGVNAAATFAVVPMGAIWLLTREPGPRRRALMLWWPLFTALGTLWWLVPLFLMGAYSPPFLDYIETSSITTLPTTIFDALRGTSNWVPYVDGNSRTGNDLVTRPVWALISGVVVFVGLAGLLRRRTPHRPFLAISLLVGLLMVTAGHQGAAPGWFADDLAAALDGVLSPLRNVHKFDPIVRLPLVLALAFVLDRAVALARARARSGPAGWGPQLERYGFVAMVVAAVAGVALPALQTRVEPGGGTLGVPGYWAEAADWLAERSVDDDLGGVALLAPGAPFAEYLWGAPKDEPMQHLADSRWAVRNVIPLTPEGTIRLLDEVEEHLVQGTGSAGFTALLRRAGVRHLVVRNDLARADDVPDPVVVHQALARSPGIGLAASFGPIVGGEAHLESGRARLVVNDGWQEEYPAIEIFEVSASDTAGVTAAEAPVVVGGPEDLGDLVDLGLLGGEPTVLAVDAADDGIDPPGDRLLLTDGLRARERSFARIHDGASPVLTAGQPRRTGSPARDYLLDAGDRWSTLARLEGAEAVRASSSTSDAGAAGGSRRGESPYAALDGLPETAWVSGSRSGPVWWELDLGGARLFSTVTLQGGVDARDDQIVRLRTSAGFVQEVDLGPGERRRIDLPVGERVTWLRVEDASGPGDRGLQLAEVQAPGLAVRRTLVLPEPPARWGVPDAVVLRADRDGRNGCVEVAADLRCAERRVRADEEAAGLSRAFTLPWGEAYRLRVTARSRNGAALEDLLLRDQPLDVAASSLALPDPRASAVAAVDGDPHTAWIAEATDRRPSFSVSWLGRRTVRSIAVELDPDTAARLPSRVLLTWPGGRRTVTLREGRAAFPAIRTDRLGIEVLAGEQVRSLGFDDQAAEVGVGIGELRLSGVPFLPLGLSADRVQHPCGTGPVVAVNGDERPTAVRASARELLAGAPVRARVCERRASAGYRPAVQEVSLSAGENRLRVDDSAVFGVDSVVLRRAGSWSTGSDSVRQRDVASPDPVTRSLPVDPDDRVAGVRENTSAGWAATRDGVELEPVVLDGWQQGWLLPASGATTEPATIEVRFTPDRWYRGGLLLGALALALLVGIAAGGRRGTTTPPPVAGRSPSVPLAAALALAGAGLLAGWAGVAVAAVTAVLLVRGRRSPQLPWLLAGLVLATAGWYAVRPWGDPAGWAGSAAWPQFLVLVPVLAALLSLPEPVDPERAVRRQGAGRWRQRIAGISTRR